MTGAPFNPATWIAEARRLGYEPSTDPSGGGLVIAHPSYQGPFTTEERRLWLEYRGDGDRALGHARRAAIIDALRAEVRT